jgi:hypothetical protein
MLIDFQNQLVSKSLRLRSHSKATNLSAHNQNLVVAVDLSAAQVALASSRLEAKIFEDASDVLLPWETTLRMTLEGTTDRDDALLRINVFTKSLLVPWVLLAAARTSALQPSQSMPACTPRAPNERAGRR